jgi:protein-S-isoprenylcysteine O-methyltransferase Ste14
LDERFHKRVYLGHQFTAHAIAIAALLSSSSILIPLPAHESLRYLGLLVMLFALVLIRYAKWSLGANYSPCQDSLVPHSITNAGPYAYVRHPLYTANILYFMGMTLVSLSALSIFVLAGLLWFFNRSARVEEKSLSARFPEYSRYRSLTKRFIPFIY